MKHSINNAEEMDSKTIYNHILPLAQKIYKSYDYIEISQKEYYDLVLKAILNSKIIYKSRNKCIFII